jgi:hypothetical protein
MLATEKANIPTIQGSSHVKITNEDSAYHFFRCQGCFSRAVRALGYRLDDRGTRVRLPAGAGNFSLYHRVQNGSGVHPAFYPMGSRGSFLGVKRPRREADHSPPSNAEVKELVELYLHSPIRLHGVVLS